MKTIFKNQVFQSILIAIISGLVITGIFFYPELEGKRLLQSDIVKFKGMSKEIADYAEKGEKILWTGNMFSGMPTYQIKTIHDGNIFFYLDYIFRFGMPRSSGFLFLYFIGFFIMLRLMRFENIYSVIGAIAFALSTYFIIIIQAGHTSKAHAIGYIAPLIGSIYISYRGKYLLGGILAALFGGLHLMTNHLQITYYFLFFIIFYLIGELINNVLKKTLLNFLKATASLSIASLFAIGPNLSNVLTTYEYSNYTTRGKTELTFEQQSTKTGLDKDYITAWSYGKDETLSLLIPNIKGGSSEPIGQHKNSLKKVKPQYRNNIAQISAYFGEQPFTSGPVYVGAIVFLLFFIGIFILDKNYFYWVLIIATIFSILLAWGRHFMPLTDWFIDNFPLYNKFRTVSTWLVLTEFTIPLIAILTLKKIFDQLQIFSNLSLRLWAPAAITILICLSFWLTPQTFNSFLTTEEQKQLAELTNQGISDQQIEEFEENIIQARAAIVSADSMRSLIFVLIATLLIFLWIRKKIKKEFILIALLILIAIDLITINKRYLKSSHFKNKRALENPYPEYPAYSFILQDKELHYRVLNLGVNTFNDASTSYFHKSIGGYHAAKLQRYQDLITYKIHPEIVQFIDVIQKNPNDTTIHKLLNDMHAINMLNTKYIILNVNNPPVLNKFRYGPAWFVDSIRFAQSADEEMLLVKQSNLKKLAIVHEQFSHLFDNIPFESDPTATISLISYHPHKLEYHYSSKKPQIVIFSEIYFPRGWEAYINNQQTEMFRANYVLRGLVCPAGNYTITMQFKPKVYYNSKKIAAVSSISFVLVSLLVIGFLNKKHLISFIKKY